MSVRTHIAAAPGPLLLDLRLTAGRVCIYVEPIEHATVHLRAADDTPPAVAMVDDAAITEAPGRLVIHVPAPGPVRIDAPPGGLGQMNFGVIATHGGTVVAHGAVTIGAGGVVVGGLGAGPTVEVCLPEGSSLLLDTTAADTSATGPMRRAELRTVSGHVHLDHVTDATVHTVSGSIGIDALAGTARLDTTSGGIRINAAAASTVTAQSVSGDITATGAPIRLDARSVSGRVTTF